MMISKECSTLSLLPSGRVLSTLTVLISLLALTACQLPNTGPFVEGTAQLKAAVASAGSAVEQELRTGFQDEDRAAALNRSWAVRNKAMSSLLRYAQSLDTIAAAGNEGSESAGRVADSVTGLAEAAGIAIPLSSEALAVATDSIKFLYGQIAKIRAAKELAESLEAAQPAVETIARLIRADLKDLQVLEEAVTLYSTLVKADEYNDLSADRKALVKALNGFDPAKPAERDDYENVLGLLNQLDIRYQVYVDELAAIERRAKTTRALIDATDRALEEWAAAHTELIAACRRNGTVNSQALIDASLEIRGLVNRMREL